MASAGVHSMPKVKVLLLVIQCFLLVPLFVGFVFGPSFLIQFFVSLLKKRKLIALLQVCSCCHVAVSVVRFFFTVP